MGVEGSFPHNIVDNYFSTYKVTGVRVTGALLASVDYSWGRKRVCLLSTILLSTKPPKTRPDLRIYT